MNSGPVPTVRHLSDAQPYAQEEPGEASFNWMIKKDEIPGLQMEHVHLQGPIHKSPAVHDEFHQTYFVYEGAATIHLGDEDHTLRPATVIMIPNGTLHSVEVAEGNELRYVFVNQFR